MANRCSRSLLLPVLSSILWLGTLPAQNSVGFSFDGTWLTSGRVDEAIGPGQPGYVQSHACLKIEGFPEVNVPIPRGLNASEVALVCMAAMAGAGFNCTWVPPASFRVTGHISGQPVRRGAGSGENDDDMKGSDLDVVYSEAAFGQHSNEPPSERGYGIARPTGTTPSQGGTIVTTLQFEGVATPTVITVSVPQGAYPQQIDQMMFQAFVQHGITPRPWQAPHMLVPNQTQPLFGLTRDSLGRRVSHVQFEPRIETEIVAMHLQSCMPITVGVTDYGWSWPATGGMSLDSASNPRIGNSLQIDLKTGLPFSFAGLVVGFSGWAMPLPQLLNGTPAPSHNGPTLFVQSVGGPITGFTNAAGELHHTLVVPADPSFLGLPLRWQGFDINAPGPTTVWLSNGLITNVGA